MKSLYKKDTKGKIRYLKIWCEGNIIYNESGLLETDSPIIHQKQTKGKNIGKSNETTPEEQAELEVASYIKKKLDEGYFDSVFEAESYEVILPMLAKDYEKEKHKIDWGSAYAQPKLDGMRCLAFVNWGSVKLISRKGVKIENMHHIEEALSNMFPESSCVLDGELYVHGETFQTNMSYVKKYRKGFSERISYNVYDIADSSLTQSRRMFILNEFRNINDNIKIVDSVKINNEDELKAFHTQAIAMGYEGSMVRWGDELYKVNGRSSNLLKYKDFLDTTATIIDIIPAEQRPEWGVPVFDGFKAGVKLSHDERVDLLRNKEEYIGKTAELRYFELTDDGSLRFPIMVGIRLDI